MSFKKHHKIPTDDPMFIVRTQNMIRGSEFLGERIVNVRMASPGTDTSGTTYPLGFFELPVYEVRATVNQKHESRNGGPDPYLDPSAVRSHVVVISGVAYLFHAPVDNRNVFQGVSRPTVAIYYDADTMAALHQIKATGGRACPHCGAHAQRVMLETLSPSEDMLSYVSDNQTRFTVKEVHPSVETSLTSPNYEEQLSPDEEEGGAE